MPLSDPVASCRGRKKRSDIRVFSTTIYIAFVLRDLFLKSGTTCFSGVRRLFLNVEPTAQEVSEMIRRGGFVIFEKADPQGNFNPVTPWPPNGEEDRTGGIRSGEDLLAGNDPKDAVEVGGEIRRCFSDGREIPLGVELLGNREIDDIHIAFVEYHQSRIEHFIPAPLALRGDIHADPGRNIVKFFSSRGYHRFSWFPVLSTR